MQGVFVDAAGQHLAGSGLDGVVGAGQAGDRVEQDDHVLLVLDQSLGFSMTISATATWRVAGSSKVEATTSPLTGAGHFGDFFRTLVDEQHDQDDFG